ncbi:MAG: BatD family protein [Halioglobus sp.]
MKFISNTLFASLVMLVTLAAGLAHGAVTANVDRNRVSLGDTLRLTITATDDEEISDQVLNPLQTDFEILNRSTSSNTSIINGRISQSRQMIVELAPRKEGTFQVPALQIDGKTTSPITIAVTPATDTHSDGQAVVFEAEVDHDSVYVQGQIILTLRVQQSVNLEGRSVSELKLDNAFVKPLEQHSFQRTINGVPWLVDELRYAIFPEHSGTLEIPAQVFSGRIDQGRRSFFDIGRGGQQVRRSTQPLSITVLPKPASFGTSDWLPARNLTLQENWSIEPDKLHVGESATRTIRIVGEGLQGAQLPPVMFTPIEGLKYYPDQPNISEQETSNGLEGIREDSAAVVPTQAGRYVIPEIRIPWWDTQTDQLQYAVLPERTITVLAAQPGHDAPSNAIPATAGDVNTVVPATPSYPAALPQQPLIWQILFAVSTLGWLVTALFLWRRRAPTDATYPRAVENVAEKQAFKQLLLACAAGNAPEARAACVSWANALAPERKIVSLEQVAELFRDQDLTAQLTSLDATLYRPESATWVGDALADCARRMRRHHDGQRPDASEQLKLYPDTEVTKA